MGLGQEVLEAGKGNVYVKAALDLLEGLSDSFDPSSDNAVYVAGGVAVIFWLRNSRVTHDLDAVFTGDLLPDSRPVLKNDILYIDQTFTDVLSLVQEDYRGRAVLAAEFNSLKVFVVAPVDLVLMKISRGTEKDMLDALSLIEAGLVDRTELMTLAEDAFKIYVGDPGFPRYNLEKLMEAFPNDSAASAPFPPCP